MSACWNEGNVIGSSSSVCHSIASSLILTDNLTKMILFCCCLVSVWNVLLPELQPYSQPALRAMNYKVMNYCNHITFVCNRSVTNHCPKFSHPKVTILPRSLLRYISSSSIVCTMGRNMPCPLNVNWTLHSNLPTSRRDFESSETRGQKWQSGQKGVELCPLFWISCSKWQEYDGKVQTSAQERNTYPTLWTQHKISPSTCMPRQN